MRRSRLPRFITPKLALVLVALVGLATLASLGGFDAPARSQPPPPAAAGPVLVVSATAVTASGMTSGGDVVWLAMLRRVVEYEAVYSRRQGVVQADAQGGAQLPVPDAAPPPQSFWIAVDLKTGAYAMASPAGFSPLLFDLAGDALNVRGDALADQLVDVADHAEILLVRPGKGAWGKGVGRGGTDDESSPTDAAYKLSLDRLEPLRGADGPSSGKLNAKDLLFVLHPEAMALAVVTFRGKP